MTWYALITFTTLQLTPLKVHGDLKGANVLISDTGVAKIADFGNTKLKEQTVQLTTRTSTPFSLRWAAPEILENSPCSMTADVYALGMETVTGDIPYADKTDTAVLVEVLVHRRFPSWNTSTVRIGNDKDQLWQLMSGCWNREAALRPTASEIEVQLDVVRKQPNVRSEGITELVELNNIGRPDNAQSPEESETQNSQAQPGRPQPSVKTQPQTSSVSRPSSSFTGTEVRRKFVFVGDAGCGKTGLIQVFSKGTFPESHHNTIFENYVADVELNGQPVELGLWDTAGLEDYDRLRLLSYPDTHVVLICFSVDAPDSLDNVTEKWIEEVKYFCTGLPVVLVGCKMDLRRDPAIIEALHRGVKVADNIGALKYLECSAKTGEGVREVVKCATEAAIAKRRKSKSDKCIIC
ncbi:GTP-binding protein Rho1 [Ceratobasidium sp. 395]|nr:GTP-binding protein Rho1 [Ceratobasidium sp. 395]